MFNPFKKEEAEDFTYFKIFEEFSFLIVETTDFLAANLKNYQVDELEIELNEMKKIEVVADEKKQTTLDFLYQDFLPPIERADILEIIQALNTFLGTVCDILARMDRYQVKTIEPDVFGLMEILEQGSDKILTLTKELIHFKHPEKLLVIMKDISTLAQIGHTLHHQAIKKLIHDKSDLLMVISYANVYDGFNHSIYALERVTSAVEATIIKNT